MTCPITTQGLVLILLGLLPIPAVAVERTSSDSTYTIYSDTLNSGGGHATHQTISTDAALENFIGGASSNGDALANHGFVPSVTLLVPSVLIIASPSGVLVASVSALPNGLQLQIHTTGNHQYTVEYRNDSPGPESSWNSLITDQDGDGDLLTLEDTGATGLEKRFYRIRIEAYGEEFASEPVGFYDLEIVPGPNLLSVPLMGLTVFKGPVAATTSGTIEVNGATGWADNQLETKNGFHQYIAVVHKDKSGSPGHEGEWWPVLDNTGNVLEVEDREEDLTTLLEAGDTIEVRALISVKDLFGFGATLSLNEDSNGFPSREEEDLFRVVEGSSYSREFFYHDGSLAQEGYYLDGEGPLDGSTLTFLPNQTLMLFRKPGSPALRVRAAGQALTTPLIFYFDTGPNAYGSAFPDPVEISSSGLIESGWQSDANGFPSRLEEDILRLVIGAGYTQEIFHHDGALTSGEPGWYVDGLPGDAHSILPRQGYMFFIKDGPRKWRQLAPY